MLANFYGQDGSYWICARIESVECFGEWFYMACKRCSKKVAKMSNRFYCDRCNKNDGTAVQRSCTILLKNLWKTFDIYTWNWLGIFVRFMFKLDVFDGSGTTQLLLWDRESVQLLGKKAADVHVKHEEACFRFILKFYFVLYIVNWFIMFKYDFRLDIQI